MTRSSHRATATTAATDAQVEPTACGEKLEEIRLAHYLDREENQVLVDVFDIPQVIEITACRYVASYTWIRGKTRSILVPGVSNFFLCISHQPPATRSEKSG